MPHVVSLVPVRFSLRPPDFNAIPAGIKFTSRSTLWSEVKSFFPSSIRILNFPRLAFWKLNFSRRSSHRNWDTIAGWPGGKCQTPTKSLKEGILRIYGPRSVRRLARVVKNYPPQIAPTINNWMKLRKMNHRRCCCCWGRTDPNWWKFLFLLAFFFFSVSASDCGASSEKKKSFKQVSFLSLSVDLITANRGASRERRFAWGMEKSEEIGKICVSVESSRFINFLFIYLFTSLRSRGYQTQKRKKNKIAKLRNERKRIKFPFVCLLRYS